MSRKQATGRHGELGALLSRRNPFAKPSPRFLAWDETVPSCQRHWASDSDEITVAAAMSPASRVWLVIRSSGQGFRVRSTYELVRVAQVQGNGRERRRAAHLTACTFLLCTSESQDATVYARRRQGQSRVSSLCEGAGSSRHEMLDRCGWYRYLPWWWA